MAKCIRSKKSGKVSRVSNQVAQWAVQAGHAEYVAKHVWKEQVRDV